MYKKITALVFILFVIGCVNGVAQEGTATEPDKNVAVKPSTVDSAKSALTVEAELCAEVIERMPAGTADSFPADVGQVYLWCRILGAKDSTMVKHVWYYKGEQVANVELPVKSSSWRTWSSKSMLPEWSGAWEVKILDAEDNELVSIPFQIVAPQPTTE